MGILVGFWSPLHGRGTTSSCIATATQLSYTHGVDIFLAHTHYTRSTMESAFLKGTEDEDMLKFSDLGIDSIERALQGGDLDEDDFRSYCNRINENLYLIAGSKKTNNELFSESVGKSFGSICRYSKEVNDLTFVDIESGFTKEIAREVVDLADIIVVTLDQTNQLCQEYFYGKTDKIDKDKEIVVIGRYDWQSKYSKAYIDKAFKTDVYTLPALTDYLDALNNHRVNKFFEDFYHMESEMFFEELNGLNQEIIRRARLLGVHIEEKLKEEIKEKKFKMPFFNR